MKTPLLAGAVLLAMSSLPAHAAEWSDASISYRYGNKFSEPGIDKDVKKNIVALTYVSGYAYGSNFFNVDVLKSDKNDPANNSTDGAQEVYLVYNHQLSYSKVSGNKISAGPINDVALSTGFDLSSKNTQFAPRVEKLIVGPTLKFGWLGGWTDLSLMYYKENNHNGIVGKKVIFDPAYRFAGAWGIPFDAGSVPMKFDGWFTYTGEKGKDGFGADTKPETWLNAFLMVDVGNFAGKKGTVYAGVGYEYVRNKFGNDHSFVPGSNTSTGMFKLEWHL